MLNAGKDHLMELRKAIYGTLHPYDDNKHLQALPKHLYLEETEIVHHRITLRSNQAIMDLLMMTPHYWHVNTQQKLQLEKRSEMECRLEMRLSVIRKNDNG